MEFLKPKNRANVNWKIAGSVRRLVEAYAEYAECSEGDVVEKYLNETIRADENFIEWARNRRFNKRLLDIL